MTFLLSVLSAAAFTASLSTRSLDPLIPQIAGDLSLSVQTVALAASAFAFTLAALQFLLGMIGDFFGKSRLIFISLLIVAGGNFIGSLTTSFEVLLASRVICAIGAGGVMPMALSLVGDIVPVERRQIALSRIVAGQMSGFLLGVTLAGVIGEFFGWRAVFVTTGTVLLGAALAIKLAFRGYVDLRPGPISVALILTNYRDILRHPHARTCYIAAFFVGNSINGLFPYLASLLVDVGQSRLAITGLMIAGFPIGGLCYAMSVRRLLPRLGENGMMRLGGLIAASQLLLLGLAPPWQVHFVCFMVMGLGYFMIHGCLQLFVSELAPNARATAIALNTTAMFAGQSTGPILYGLGFSGIGRLATLGIGALTILAVGLVCAQLLRRPQPHP